MHQNNKLHQNGSSLQLATEAFVFRNTFFSPSPQHQVIPDEI
jgi:hypothetical protein